MISTINKMIIIIFLFFYIIFIATTTTITTIFTITTIIMSSLFTSMFHNREFCTKLTNYIDYFDTEYTRPGCMIPGGELNYIFKINNLKIFVSLSWVGRGVQANPCNTNHIGPQNVQLKNINIHT